MKTVVISVPYAMSARNVLRSDIFRRLKKEARIVILSPLAQDKAFREEFSEERVSLELLPKNLPWVYKVYRGLLDIAEGFYFTRKTMLESLLIMKEELKKTYPSIYYAKWLLGRLLTFSQSFFQGMRRGQRFFLRSWFYDRLFQKYRPQLVFSTHPLTLEEQILLFNAKRSRIPIISMIHSWDSLSCKSGIAVASEVKRSGRMLPPFQFDKLIVWNEVQKEELKRFYDYKDPDIFIGGIPQFDHYRNGLKLSTRDEFLKSIGGNPAKKLITFACGNRYVIPRQSEVINLLIQAVEGDQLVRPCQLLIRSHPGIKMDEVRQKIKNSKTVFFDESDLSASAKAYSRGWESDSNEDGLAEIICHSDVLISVFSTLALDCAALDKPNICIGFDGNSPEPPHKSIKRYYKFTHYKPVLELRASKLAHGPEELIRQINDYLERPHLDAEARRELVQKICCNEDGKSGQRIGEFLVNFLQQTGP